MKKHILGLVLFSFIVGASAVVYSFFRFRETTLPMDTVYLSEKPTSTVFESDAQIGKIDAHSPVVRQAIFNFDTKEMNFELEINGKERTIKSFPIKLSFFKKSGKETKFIASDSVGSNLAFIQFDGETVSARVARSYEWLNNLDSYDNLYVVAEAQTDKPNTALMPTFDARFARAVSLYSTNGGFLNPR